MPTLFIHGDQDKFVPFYMLDKLYEAANCKKEKLVISDAGHVESSKINPDLYWSTINKFIKNFKNCLNFFLYRVGDIFKKEKYFQNM